MSKITTLFWDIGGVLLTNGWDFPSRKKASQEFNFDLDDFEDKHAQCEEAFEIGRISIDDYLKKTLFFKTRPFSQEDFKAFMFSLSEAYPQAIEIARLLKDSQKYQMHVINNESLELNLYRIEKFHLRDYFTDFFSSSFLGMRKPNREIYDKVLQITQRKPEECILIDDRQNNLEQARILGMSTIHYDNADDLWRELRSRLEI